MAAFNKTHAPTSKKYAPEEGIMIPNLLQTLQCFWPQFSVKNRKIWFFRAFFTSQRGFVPTFRKYFAEQDISMPNLLHTFRSFLVASFQSFFTSYMGNGDCFHGNGCTHFQIVFSSARYNNLNILRIFRCSWLHSSVSSLEK